MGSEHRAGEPGARAIALAAAGSVVLAVGLTWPVALHPASRLVGHPGDDVWNHAWGYAWVADSLAAGELPRWTDRIAWPDGGALWFIDFAVAAALAPVTWAFGPAVAFNAAVLGGFALAAFAAWLLAARVSGAVGPALLAAAAYGAAPHLLGQAYNGISETMCAGFFPLCLWVLLRLLDRPGPRIGVLLGLCGAATALTSWYYGMFAAVGGLVLIATAAARDPRGVRRAAPWLGLAVAVAVAGAGPALWAFRASLEAGDALVTRDPGFVSASLLQPNLTDALAYVRPSHTPSPDLKRLFGEDLVIIIYLGWTTLALAAVGVVARRRAAAPWMWMALFFFLFSLGPYLYWGGEFATFGGRRVPLPFLPLFEAVPIFQRISHPFRFAMGLSLAVGVLGSMGLAALTRRARVEVGVIAGLAAAALFVVEVAVASPATLPVPTSDATIPDAISALRGEPGAVLDLPMALPNLERAVYVWAQTAHGRPVPWGLNDPMPAWILENRLTATLLRLEASRAASLPPDLPVLELAVSARLLARQGLGVIVVHDDLMPEGRREAVHTLLQGLFGAPERPPGARLALYRVAPVEVAR